LEQQRGEHTSDSQTGSIAAAFPLAIANIRLDSLSPLPIHEQICQAIRAAIAAQELPPGALLPPSRELALHLGVARNTVVYAYARLVAEGLCVSNTRRGTRIASDFPSRAQSAKDSAGARSRLHVSTRTAFHVQSALGVAIDRMPDGTAFTLNASDPALYPRTKLGRRIAGKYLDVTAKSQAPYGLAAAGATRFQTSLAAFLRSARGVVCAPQQIIPVTGLEGALDLTARVLLDPGDTVQVQDPAMDIVHGAFYAARANIVPIPTDAHGADPESVVGPPARLMFVAPSVSFPHGTQMSEQRRNAVLKAAYAQNAIIFENDAYCELRYCGARLSSIQGLDGDGQVVYYSGFMETLGDSMNVGYLVVPEALRDAFVEMNRRIANAPPPQLQEAVAEFVEEHEYAFHARNVRGVYAERLEAVKQACKDLLPDFPTSEPNGGLFVVLRCSDHFDDVAICAEATAEGVPVRPLSRYYAARASERGVVFGFGAVPGRSIRSAVQQLAQVFARHESGSSKTP
jgi:GntR family transcriptional regulator/MocR family aminotransferase